MNTRIIIPLLCVGALALACSTRVHSDRTSPVPLATMMSVARTARHGAPGAARPRLASSFGVHVGRKDVAFDLDVTNIGGRDVELTFPSGRAYDFVVVDSLGHEVWRWTKGRLFTQTMRTRLLDAGGVYRVDETWPAPKAKGRYTAIAMLNSTNYPVEERVDFDVR